MTALDKDKLDNDDADRPEKADEVDSGAADLDFDGPETEGAADEVPPAYAAAAQRHSKRAAVRARLRDLEQRAIHLPIVGKFHTPDKHEFVYVAALAGILAIGAVELPVALLVLGGHMLVKQHESRSLSAIGEVIEDVFSVHIGGSPTSGAGARH